MNMVGCDSEAIRYRDTVVCGYLVVYGCAEGNRLAEWYWDCEHHKCLRVNAEIRSLGSGAGRWSDGKCCRCNDGIFRNLEFAERVI